MLDADIHVHDLRLSNWVLIYPWGYMVYVPAVYVHWIYILTPQRGQHNIENQMIFESNPGFIFHDSHGFEAGDAEELNMVQRFIEQCSRARKVNEQLHAIWCVCARI